MYYCIRSNPFLHHRLSDHLIQYCLRIHCSVIRYCHLCLKNYFPLGTLRPRVALHSWHTTPLLGYLAKGFLRRCIRADINGVSDQLMDHYAFSL